LSGQRIVIAGASGFIGQYLIRRFRDEGESVVTVGRSGSDIAWGDTAALEAALDGADVLVNLAGKSVNARYTHKNRAAIFRSRLLTTGELGRAVESVANPPALWFNSSTATIYRHADDRPMTDEDGQIGNGFSVNVATAWEREFFSHHRDGVRQVALRMAIVLGTTHGGRQMFSWVHIDDVYRAIRFIQADAGIDGPVNVAAPGPVQNIELMATLRRAVGARFGLPLYRWMLEIGSVALQTETELLLKSRWVVPTRLLAEGFVFDFPQLEDAVRDITGAQARREPAPLP
jgi:NAD dependent epimerase/dehydratase family enzyme